MTRLRELVLEYMKPIKVWGGGGGVVFLDSADVALQMEKALRAVRVEALEEAARVVEEHESNAFAEFSNQRDKLKAGAHLDGIVAAIRQPSS